MASPPNNGAPSSSAAPSSRFKFLITTDNHLGYQEKDARRGPDSFVTFEECLRAAAVEHNVDAILLAGDLFHENKPSQPTMCRTMALMRRYVMGNKPIRFQMLSDPAVNFPTPPLPCANFQDPNLNVSFPIFTIHGNHDDPMGGSSAIDLLAHAGLVNHFGTTTSLEDIIVRPILLQKGDTFIALYGLGSLRDERLHRCFQFKKIQFLKPKPPPGGDGRWFNILLFHQNRGVRGGFNSKGGIPESMLNGYGFDLVIWGNEHEQLMVPQPSPGGFDVVQPGSSIMTSLSGSECNPKQYGILEVKHLDYRLTPFPLRSVRPVVRRHVELWRDQPSARSLEAVEKYLRKVAEEMIDEAEEQVANIPDDVLTFHPDLKFPLMRLAVDFSNPDGGLAYPQPAAHKFGQQFLDVVVNPQDVLKPVKPKPQAHIGVRSVHGPTGSAGGAEGVEAVAPIAPHISTTDIRNKILSVFNANAKDACQLLSEAEVASAVHAYADKGDKHAIETKIQQLVFDCQTKIWKSFLKTSPGGVGELREDVIREVMGQHKGAINERYRETMGRLQGDDQDDVVGVVGGGGGGPRSPVGAASSSAALREVDAFLKNATSTIGAPLPKTSSRVVEAPVVVDDDDAEREDDAEAFDHVVLQTVSQRPARAVNHHNVDGEDDDDEERRGALAPAAVTVGKKPPAKRSSAATKRSRDDGATTTTTTRSKKPAAAGPTLALSTTEPAAPPRGAAPAPAAGGLNNILAQWGR